MMQENFQPMTEQEINKNASKKDQTGTEELLAALRIPATSLLEGWRDNYLKNLVKIRADLLREIEKMPEGKRKETKKLELAELEEDIRQVQAGATRLEKFIEEEN